MSFAKDVKRDLTKDIKKEYDRLAKDVETQRDELKVRLHLLNMDAKAEWNGLEKKYEQLRGKLKQTSRTAEASSEDVKAAVDTLAKEIRTGYKRIKSSL
jgi:hypothetical protein